MTILDVCDQKTATVSSDATVAQAIQVMISAQVGAVAVVDKFQRICGIFTERDVLMKVAAANGNPSKTSVHELMPSPLETAIPDITPIEALALMAQGHFLHP